MRVTRPALVALLLLALTAAPAAATRPSADAAARAEHDRVVRFWTPERMASATPRDFVRTPTGFVPASNHRGKPGGGSADLSKAQRLELAGKFRIFTSTVRERRQSPDGTEKLLVALEDGDLIEAVLIREGDRKTICVSTQVGCPVKCVFCARVRAMSARVVTAASGAPLPMLFAMVTMSGTTPQFWKPQ